jgi:hypothetical protein
LDLNSRRDIADRHQRQPGITASRHPALPREPVSPSGAPFSCRYRALSGRPRTIAPNASNDGSGLKDRLLGLRRIFRVPENPSADAVDLRLVNVQIECIRRKIRRQKDVRLRERLHGLQRRGCFVHTRRDFHELELPRIQSIC